jgi:GST-like protein
MLDLYFAPTPNGWKITIMLAECGLEYRLKTVDLFAGEQHEASFRELNPNGRIPVLVDHEPVGGGPPRAIFESGAILLYLAGKTGMFIPSDAARRDSVIQWLMWQVSALGPTLGHNGHFKLYASEKIPYAIERFARETDRLYGVLEGQLARTGRYVSGDEYTIADIACFPWVMTHKAQGVDMSKFPAVKRWFTELRARPGVVAGTAVGKMIKVEDLDPEQRRRFFNLGPAVPGSEPGR